MLKICSDLGHSCDLGVGHSCDLPPPKIINKNNILFFRLLMILGLAKNPQSGRACAPGGSAPPGSWRPPALGRAVGFLPVIGREAPCGPSGRSLALSLIAKAAQEGVDQARRGGVIPHRLSSRRIGYAGFHHARAQGIRTYAILHFLERKEKCSRKKSSRNKSSRNKR
jgi:hypothetical protein